MKRKIVITLLIIAALIAALYLFLNRRGTTDIVVDAFIQRITVTSTAFDDMGVIPDRHTGRDADLSPDLHLSDLSDKAVSVAIIMDDLDVPWSTNFTHWVAWNLPPSPDIPEGDALTNTEGVVQGTAFGRNRYRGPMPPFGTHRYTFHVFVLDTTLELDASSGKHEVLTAMEGHILQYGTLTGWYPRASE